MKNAMKLRMQEWGNGNDGGMGEQVETCIKSELRVNGGVRRMQEIKVLDWM